MNSEAMKAIMQQVQAQNQQLEEYLNQGQIDDFLRLIEERRTLLQQIADDPIQAAHCKAFMNEMRTQTENWLQYARSQMVDLQNQINHNKHKRCTLARLGNAYAGHNHAGNLLSKCG